MEIFYSADISDGLVRLDEEQSGHCVRVLRHRAGDEVLIIDGRGTLYHCRLENDSPKAATALILSEEKDFGAHPYHLEMAVCPTKNADRFEWFAEKATEVGVDVISPVIGERSERKVFKTERLHRLVLSAAKQSLKGAVPEVREPVSVRDFITSCPEGAIKLIAYCFEGEQRRVSVLEALGQCRGRDIIVLIGPEGDFSPAEVSAALAAGFQPVHLGSSRLRTETAALTAVEAVYLKNLD